jgi:hypothetical protein
VWSQGIGESTSAPHTVELSVDLVGRTRTHMPVSPITRRLGEVEERIAALRAADRPARSKFIRLGNGVIGFGVLDGGEPHDDDRRARATF